MPYSLNWDLANEINKYIRIVPNQDDWICIYDGDTIWTQHDWGDRIRNMIEANKNEYDLLTCLATRISIKEQKLNGAMSKEENLNRLSRQCEIQYNRGQTFKADKVDNPIGGYFLCFRKRLGIQIPFISSTKGILGVDGTWTKELLKRGKRIGICKKIAIIHFYRLNKHYKDVEHLFKDGSAYLVSRVDNEIRLTPHFKGLPNKTIINIKMQKGIPVRVPHYVAEYYSRVKPKVFFRYFTPSAPVL